MAEANPLTKAGDKCNREDNAYADRKDSNSKANVSEEDWNSIGHGDIKLPKISTMEDCYAEEVVSTSSSDSSDEENSGKKQSRSLSGSQGDNEVVKESSCDASKKPSTSRKRSLSRSRSRSRRQRDSNDRRKSSRRRRSRSRGRRRRSRSRDRRSHHRSHHRSHRRHDRSRHSPSYDGRPKDSKGRPIYRHGRRSSSPREKQHDRRRPNEPRSFKEQLKQSLLKDESQKNSDAFKETVANMHLKTAQITGVQLSNFPNLPHLSLEQQMQKRKLLWHKSKAQDEPVEETKQAPVPTAKHIPQPGESQWQGALFNDDSDGKVAAKFRKLMGIKNETPEVVNPELVVNQQQRQAELFCQLDKEYESARMATHTHRGVGLGFTSSTISSFPRT